MQPRVPYEQNGRSGQKRRTRDALIAAARDIVATGATPTVDSAAEAASISRTTAYRYFPNQTALLVAAHPEIGATSLLPDDPPDDVSERLDLAVDAVLRSTLENETQQRTMLRLSLAQDAAARADLPLRQGRAIGWFEDALSPLAATMSKPDVHRLALAVRSAVGIEALIWLTDIAQLSREQATHVMRWSARAMLRAAIADGEVARARPRPKARARKK